MLAQWGDPPLISRQVQYSLLARAVEWEILPAGVDAGLGTLLYGPLGQGRLTGKYRRDQQPRPARGSPASSDVGVRGVGSRPARMRDGPRSPRWSASRAGRRRMRAGVGSTMGP
ncbi:aldo/keto reductase [Streptomyces sp. NPDC019937]|uniref:aldo/keto reductase n=1 Tax=Streptomyces sp. NPDC019937 TaxID=3154787 RepID=UPI0033FE1C78